MWLDNALMVTCGWIGGAASALLLLRVLDERKPVPIDPALLPKREPMTPPVAAQLPPAPDLSPYAPKPKLRRASPDSATVTKIWRAAKQDRPTVWQETPASPQPPAAGKLLPSIRWGQK